VKLTSSTTPADAMLNPCYGTTTRKAGAGSGPPPERVTVTPEESGDLQGGPVGCFLLSLLQE
jgi:hypothetical protein